MFFLGTDFAFRAYLVAVAPPDTVAGVARCPARQAPDAILEISPSFQETFLCDFSQFVFGIVPPNLMIPHNLSRSRTARRFLS